MPCLDSGHEAELHSAIGVRGTRYTKEAGLAGLHHGAHARWMTRASRALILGFFLTAFAGAAAARDFIVVGSTDPAIPRGQAYDGGAKVALAPGRTLTLMHASGDLVRLKGTAGGALLPRRQSTQPDTERLAILKVIVAAADKKAIGVARPMRTRAGICPEASAITTLDGVVQAHRGGCATEAAQALDAWIAARPQTNL